MTTKRLAILLLVVTVGFSAVFLLPKSAAQPFGIKLELSRHLDGWVGEDEEITQKERDTLGKGTEFARKRYRNDYLLRAPGYSVLVSIVLSGHDMSNSIHRPERCLDAQGWTRLESSKVDIDLPDHRGFSVTRLHNRMSRRGEDGETRSLDAFSYYWFVGEKEIEASHWGRWFTDNKDRLLRGVNQRWAFITVTGTIPPQADAARQAEARKFADETVRDFIKKLAPTIHGDGLVYQ
jgi:hypothetical protein